MGRAVEPGRTTPPAGLDDLAAFARVAELRSFTRAAAALGTSTSNLSHTVRRLETRVGARLLQRNSRSVSPTPAGAELLAVVGPALGSIGEAIEALDRDGRGVTGTLRITATVQAHQAVIRPVLPAFLSAHPDACVEVVTDYGFRDIVADGFDAGLRLGEKLEQDMVALKVGPALRMAVVASPAYLARHGRPADPRALTGHRCINYRMVSAGAIYAWEFERDGEELAVRTPGPLTFSEPGLMLDAALDGLGVAYLLEHEVEPHVRAGRLESLLADWLAPFPGFHLYHPSRRQVRPVLAAFIAALQAHGR